MLKHMKAHKHLKPGEYGTLRLVEKFGDALLCIRYRYDAIRDMRIKTVEIIVDEKPGKGPPRIRETDIVLVQVPFTMQILARPPERRRCHMGPKAKAVAGTVGSNMGGPGIG